MTVFKFWKLTTLLVVMIVYRLGLYDFEDAGTAPKTDSCSDLKGDISALQHPNLVLAPGVLGVRQLLEIPGNASFTLPFSLQKFNLLEGWPPHHLKFGAVSCLEDDERPIIFSDLCDNETAMSGLQSLRYPRLSATVFDFS